MDLGLSELGDEQLLELVNAAVMEVVSRDPIVQRVAQDGIASIAIKHEEFMGLVKLEIAYLQKSYDEELRKSVRQQIHDEVVAGTLNIPGMMGGAKEEAKIIAEVSKEEIDKILKDMKKDPEKNSFTVHYDGRTKSLTASYHSADRNFDVRRQLHITTTMQEGLRKAVLGVFGIPTV